MVATLIPNEDTNRLRETFLRQVFGENKGYVCIAYASKSKKNSFTEEFFYWPNEANNIIQLVAAIYSDNNVWFCPHLLSERRRKKELVEITPCAWADLDTCHPREMKVKPTITVESSPGRWQAYWMFEKPVDPDNAENISQRIAYEHANEGADRSGWDLTQLLRFPFTYNFKYVGTTPVVFVTDVNRARYRLEDFEEYPQIEGFQYLDIEMPSVKELVDGAGLLDKHRLKISPTIWKLFQEELDPKKSWSEPLWQLEMMLFEVGFDRVQVYSIVREAKCNKYKKKEMSERLLWKEVCRAETTYQRNSFKIEAKGDYQEKPLLTEDEKKLVERSDTFIERYIIWAKSLGDAASQYHQAGAFIALSALLAGSVQLPTSFGTIKPNLWFMILADTTLTRKSTAMDIAMDLVMEVNDDVIMATDGSIEGLLTSLSTRTGQPSVFLRDEFSGLLEMITKKDYYAGMPEFLTKLYDGKMQKRILRKESIEVRDPCLLIFAGGIKNKITSLLSLDHVSSGFMPRFIFITAESDITKVKPLGPPTHWTDNNKDAILNELQDMYNFYQATTNMVIKGTSVSYEVKKKWDAELTNEAWMRYNVLEDQMLEAGMNSNHPEVMTPVGDRLSKSILKAAVLIAAAEQKREDGKVIVELVHILRAISYGEQWRMYSKEIIGSIGKSGQEKVLDQILEYVTKHPGTTRSRVMQTYHLNSRETSFMLETLEQRGVLSRQRAGRGEVLYPVAVTVSAKELANVK